MQGIDKVYVLHCKRGYEERARSIESQFSKAGIDFEYVLDWDIADLTENEKIRFAPSLTAVSISVCMKHFEAMARAKRENLKRVLIFEDDVFLSEGFKEKAEQVAEEFQNLKAPSVAYLSNSCNKYTPRSRRMKRRFLYENDHSRAADAYLVNLDTCRLRIKWIDAHKITLPIDHIYTKMDRELGIKMYWVENPICEQGSMMGIFPSAIDNRYSLWMQRLRWNFDKFYKMHVLRNLR